MSKQQQQNTIYISGIPSSTNEDTLFTAFQPFGEIVEIHIPKQQQQQRTGGNANDDKVADGNRGFGFIVFSSSEAVEGAIDNMHLNEIDGRVITCTLAKPLKGSLSNNPSASSRKAIWEDEEWIKQYGTGEDEPQITVKTDQSATVT